ncbi:ABC transporter ATP-binding protein [Halomonas lysinitropha]|uniref:Polysialic acid transport ATP-binding protein KpsT n=1 Tax=Halomonas lysinitropha TaxID=2607506 RepID=A0A5K1I259_9GAMM|nr:ABC transporter ATP-binding protein [Halomonas lysinitropha]VVZ95515.1 Polysialic acid transport ATP-binding protein KpsT [Halomonas lysinitropha]
MIEINGLYKRYHLQRRVYDWVLEDINLTIPQGVSVGLLGRNGAGKSTLLRLIAGMDTPDRGTIHRHCRVSWPIGLAGGFQGSMTGRQNVKFVARVHGGRGDVHEIIERVQAFAELGDAFDEPIKTYSSGMRARLNFGLSLAFDFDIYLSDEATSVGDRAFKAKATQAFKEKVGEASLVMVSHSEGILKDLCDSGIYLKDGHATWYDDIDDAIAVYHEETDAARAASGSAEPAATPADSPPVTPLREAQSLDDARAQLREVKAEFDTARAEFERAQRDDDMAPRERQTYGDAFRASRERLHDARRQVQALQKGEE